MSKTRLFGSTVLALALLTLWSGAVSFVTARQNVDNYLEQGGSRTVIGGSIDVVSGGDLDVESGATWAIAGTTVLASAAELNAIDGYTGDTADLNFLDGALAGTQVASKAVIADANVNTGVVKATAVHIGATGSEVEVTATPLELNQLDGLSATAALPLMDGCTFTEDATNATHTCTVTIPANSWLIDIYAVTSVLWTDAETSLSIGDADAATGWFNDVDLAATDLLVGEQLSITDGGSWGGKEGAYLVAATGVRGQAIAAYASRYVASASEVIGVVTMTTPSGSAGRSHMVVVYASPTLVAATAAP